MGSPVFWLTMFWRKIQTFQSSLLPQSSGNCKNGIPWRWGGKLICSICTYTPVIGKSYAQRLETSSAFLWEPWLPHLQTACFSTVPSVHHPPLLSSFGNFLSYSFSICLWFFYVYPHFFISLKQIFKPTLIVTPVYNIADCNMVCIVVYSRKILCFKEKELPTILYIFVKTRPLYTTDSFPLHNPRDKFTHLCAKEQGQWHGFCCQCCPVSLLHQIWDHQGAK